MPNQLDKILNFVRRTKEKAILFRNEGEFVIMSLDDYNKIFQPSENIKNFSEDELLKNINREIALWKESKRAFDEKTNGIDELNEFNALDYLDYNKISDSKSLPLDRGNSDHKDKIYKNYNKFNIKFDNNNTNNFDDNFNTKDKKDEIKYDPLNNKENDIEVSYISDLDADEKDLLFDNLNNKSKGASKKEIYKPNKKINKPKINNFGYLNPQDTTDFSKIPPPPALTKD